MSVRTKSNVEDAPVTAGDIVDSFRASVESGQLSETPYRHWFLRGCLPGGAAANLLSLPFVAPDLGGVSGKRELHNDQRVYCDEANQAKYPVFAALAGAFQDRRTTDLIGSAFGTRLDGTYLRIEYAQDVDGFWLEPHTDLGVKLFTMLLYLSRDDSHRDLGTDIYDAQKRHVARPPFESNAALVFVPSNVTYHGFEKRPIAGVRKSVIINYVTNEWRAREQLASPNRPV
jgi:hypothetical protein